MALGFFCAIIGSVNIAATRGVFNAIQATVYVLL